MDENFDVDQPEDVMLPGFRFHPTDEELVGFYLKRKIQQQSLPIELIKQVNIYKYDPWDLPKLATTGEKEWYFYCQRDRKYRNSTRPNRVTGAGFWKATGTDRPIYSSNEGKCIGLKKSLVFYRGRAAKGMKTDWMMHEFRLPSLPNSIQPEKLLDKTFPANDSWAICRIFKKTNSMAHKALSHSWLSSFPETTTPLHTVPHGPFSSQFSSENNTSSTTQMGSALQFCSITNHDFQQASNPTFSALEIPTYKHIIPPLFSSSNGDLDLPNPFMFSPFQLTTDSNRATENMNYNGSQEQLSGFSISFSEGMQGNTGSGENGELGHRKNNAGANQVDNIWGPTMRSIGFPFSLPQNDAWDSDSQPCLPSEMSTSYSTNTRFTL